MHVQNNLINMSNLLYFFVVTLRPPSVHFKETALDTFPQKKKFLTFRKIFLKTLFQFLTVFVDKTG